MTITPTTAQTTLSERVAEEIRGWMGKRRISGAAMARALGVSQMWVSYRLSGRQPIDLNDLAGIARVLRVPLISLIPEGDRQDIAPYLSPSERPMTVARGPRDNRPSGHPMQAFGHSHDVATISTTRRTARIRRDQRDDAA